MTEKTKHILRFLTALLCIAVIAGAVVYFPKVVVQVLLGAGALFGLVGLWELTR